LIIELRTKYLNILKSIYWSKYEQGQMNSEAIIVLLESADTELDRFDTPISDWDDIERQIGDANPSWLSLKLVKYPLIGNFIKKKQFDKISTHYDIIVNFIESHQQAHKLIK